MNFYKKNESMFTMLKEEKVKELHRKLAYLSAKNMGKLIEKEMIRGMYG